MSRSRHTEAQIIAALGQVEAGRTTEAMARQQAHDACGLFCVIGDAESEMVHRYAHEEGC